jgi:dihydrofolate reductase
MKDFMKRIDGLFVGRKSFEMIGDKAFGKKKHYVFSNTLKKTSGDTEIIKGDVVVQVNKIKAMEGKDIWLFGGASLTTSLMNEGLVDELWLAVHPILLGQGKALFQGIQDRIKTKLMDSKTYATGLVSLLYQVVPDQTKKQTT